MQIPPEEMEICLEVLQRIADSSGTISRGQRFNSLISKIYREGKRHDLRTEKNRRLTEDRALLATTSMVKIQRDAVSPTSFLPPGESGEPVRTLNDPECCYVCKEDYYQVHFFYHLLCPQCAEFNYRMRHLSVDLKGRTALVTGGRVKIGYQLVLKMLRDGAKVIVTTRFANTAARRFYAESDSADWHDRLHIYPLDLRNIPAVESFAKHLLETESHLDIIVNNAAQTIKRPHGFYRDLYALEERPQDSLSIEAQSLVHSQSPVTGASERSSLTRTSPAAMVNVMDVLPTDSLEDNEERADSRDTNSWLLRLDEVAPVEMLEVQLVNSVAPFMLNSLLKPLMMRSPFERKFIINVSAMEGQFRRHKTVFHPHTNMAKAALNMMSRTSGEDYAKDGIYMNSVDTGWVTDENPTPKRNRVQDERAFFPPLDIVDGMARLYHPIATGILSDEEPPFGHFLKDYAPAPW